MEKYIPTFTDITLWQKRNFINTGGTRAKFVSVNEQGEVFYFKGSKETREGDIRYPLEFWSEILSSKIGQILGFEILDYNIGYDSKHIQKIGCLSKSMINQNDERLTEGITYLKGFSPNYNPLVDKKKYTFHFIKQALIHHKIDKHLQYLIDTIIFDCIVGNSDRHQENWGFIRKYIEIKIENLINSQNDSSKNWVQKIRNLFLNKRKREIHNRKKVRKIIRINLEESTRFSPIYDSGCCLAREKNDDEIQLMNKDIQLIEKYINKGKSEIHWDEKKVTHFNLVELLLNDYADIVKNRIKKVKENFDANNIISLVNNIDANLPDFCNEYKLTKERKEVIIKIVNLRIEKLLSLL